MALAAPVRASRAGSAATATAAAARAASRPTPRAASPPSGAWFQAKFVLGPRADTFEHEADIAAAHVVGGREGVPSLSALAPGGGHGQPLVGPQALAQRACGACRLGDDETRSRIQRKCACGATAGESCTCAPEEAPDDAHPEFRVDRAAKSDRASGDAAIRAVEDTVAGPGRPLPVPVRRDMEAGFGRDFSAVRIHDSARAAASAEGIGAHAYTVGNHIAFNHGRFRPDTGSGRLLLAHELAHTVQQSFAPMVRPASRADVSRPADHHEAEAQRAALAAVAGGPAPALSQGATTISRYSLEEFGEDLLDTGEAIVDGAVEVGSSVADAAGGLWDTAVAIASAIGGAVSLDGTTIVIDVPAFDPCPDIEFSFQLSDLGLDPTLYFPIVAGALSIGVVDVIGALGIEVNLDPGVGFRLEECSFGPAQIRIDPLSARASVAGMGTFTTGSMVSLGADLGLRADATGVVIVPFDPPIVLIAPIVGLALGGTMQLMLQNRGTIDHQFMVSLGIGGMAAATQTEAEIGYALDLAYGLYGSVDIMGLDLCRVGWPLDSVHEEIAARLTLSSALSLDTGGLSFDFAASAAPLGSNPLDDLSFAFDPSRLEDECWLCDFFASNNLFPGQNGKNWSSLQPTIPVLAGPLPGIYERKPWPDSEALCRGACGVDCPPEPTCTEPYDRVECENVGDHHVWHTYVNYAACGTHQGCRDHDACYDYAGREPIWGFGGYLIGPMYRACDLEAMCHYSFQQGVTWATGGGPYDGQLEYADYAYSTPGCLGSCPVNAAEAGEPELMQTCLEDRRLWEGMAIGDQWGIDFGSTRLYQGFVEVPWIVGVHYGIDASARADAEAFAELGPVNLENACLSYDAASGTYTGMADLVLYLNGGAGASVTGRLDGWLADFLCVLQVVKLGGWVNAGVQLQFPSELRFGVNLYCANGDLEVQPLLDMSFCVNAMAEFSAGFDVTLLGFVIHEDDWGPWSVALDECWQFELPMDPFLVGEMPSIEVLSTALDVFSMLADLFDEASPRQSNRRPPRNPIPASGVLFPCLSGGDDDDDDGGDADCPRLAKNTDGVRLFTAAERAPRWGPVNTLAIPGPGGGSAGVGTWMEVQYLCTPHGRGSPTNDRVQRGIYKRVGLPTKSCVGTGYKQSQVYIKGHLLNENVGGPAEERNLFPITGQANSNHKNQVEQGGLDVVHRVRDDGDLLYYKVTVQNVSQPSEIRTSAGSATGLFEISATFHCEVADYRYCNNDTVQRNTARSADIRSEFVFHPSGGEAFDTIMRPCSR